MSINDEMIQANQRLWEEEVKKECGYTVPWLDLDVDLLRDYAAGKIEVLPEPYNHIYPPNTVAHIEGKEVLCLASGGGQQSAVFGLLGARVTVVDLTEGQLDGDRKAASHYGYNVTTVQTDMSDLSKVKDNSFDLIYQPESMCYVPDIRQVFSEVARVLKPGGTYRVVLQSPVTFFRKWNGDQYYINTPYSERILRREDGGIEFRHYTADIFNGLLDAGLSLQRVHEAIEFRQQSPEAFVIVARKG